MEFEDFKEKFIQYLNEENYIAAYSNLRESKYSKMERNELAGILVNDLIKELDAIPTRGKSEKRTMLRSMLLWVFRDYPGLAQLYKNQLRSNDSDQRNLLTFLSDMRDPDKARERVGEEVDNLFDNVKQNLDDTADDIKTGRAQDKMKDFIDQAEHNIRDGIRNLADIFESVTKNKDDSDKPD